MSTRFRRFLALALAASAWAAGAEPLAVTGAWVRATPPGARTAAAYLTLSNSGAAADRLLGAATPAAREVQLHTHVTEAGMQRMVQLPEILLPASATVRLEPGGLHLMLLDITAPLVPGAGVALRLRFANAATIDIVAPVVDARAPAAPAHGVH